MSFQPGKYPITSSGSELCPAYNLSAQAVQKTHLLLLVACCEHYLVTAAVYMVTEWQQVYMLQYINLFNKFSSYIVILQLFTCMVGTYFVMHAQSVQ